MDRYLPPYKPLAKLDLEHPGSLGGGCTGEQYTHFRYQAYQAMQRARSVAREAMAEFEQVFDRRYGVIERDPPDGDADLAVIAAGSMCGTVRQVVREMRAKGKRVALVKLRMFRPLPVEDLLEAIARAPKVAVIDRDATLDVGGLVCQEIKAMLYGRSARPVFGFITGLGGVDITPDRVRRMIDFALENDAPAEPVWVEVNP